MLILNIIQRYNLNLVFKNEMFLISEGNKIHKKCFCIKNVFIFAVWKNH